jgi:hypothetical protein
MTDIDLNFIARQLERMLSEQRSLRDDMAVLSAMVMRVDHGVLDMSRELQAIHQLLISMGNRIRKLEDAEG